MKQIARPTSCLAICRPFEPNLNVLAITLTYDGNCQTLPLEERTEGSSKRSFFCPLGCKCASKEKKIKLTKDWRKEKKNRKEIKKMYKEVLCTRQCLNNVQNCQKQKRKEDSDSNLVKTLGMREANTYLVTNQILYPCWSHIEPKKKK